MRKKTSEKKGRAGVNLCTCESVHNMLNIMAGRLPPPNPNGRTDVSRHPPHPPTHGPLLTTADRQISEKVLKKFVCQTPPQEGEGMKWREEIISIER